MYPNDSRLTRGLGTEEKTIDELQGAAALIAFAAYVVDRRQVGPSRLSFAPEEEPVPAMATAPYRAILQGALLLSGFAAIGYEVVWTRILVLLMGSSTYAFSMMLGTYLLGLAFGALWIGRYLDQLKAPGTALRHLQLAVAIREEVFREIAKRPELGRSAAALSRLRCLVDEPGGFESEEMLSNRDFGQAKGVRQVRYG